MTDEIFQESDSQKEAWLEEAKRRMPLGTRVKVIRSDVDEYVGATGTVIDYDVGFEGDWPLISVRFDTPISYPGSGKPSERDGFYCDGAKDDEIEKL